ncbi:MAG: SAM-dependent chlorinase/fluorinase [Desulfobacterium sp.]|nr:SAM-dependent chlorinase/fluorinase [Desulfobacterium sp.]MBU3947316.1 SAM-dependent chlorinase/fluorinase [Pseudomonadota bacterium]MBU4037003.1 SAM-dependent chlorinase/fluorinase [Pseudomonadota bacterium]
MPVITLLTDFGINDEYVGIMKGVVLSINPAASIVDISHCLSPYDIVSAAYLIEYYYKYFPKGSIHVIVVDPGVGSNRAILAVLHNGHYFIAADNGVLTLLFKEGKSGKIIKLDKNKYFLKPVSNTFHGRDIFSPVAAYLSDGVSMEELGTPISRNTLVSINIEKPEISDDGELVGEVVSIDHFGNLLTNIDSKKLDEFCSGINKKDFHIIVGKNKIDKLSLAYEHAGLNKPLAIIGSRGFLEIAVNQGSAEVSFAAKKRDKIRIVKK